MTTGHDTDLIVTILTDVTWRDIIFILSGRSFLSAFWWRLKACDHVAGNWGILSDQVGWTQLAEDRMFIFSASLDYDTGHKYSCRGIFHDAEVKFRVYRKPIFFFFFQNITLNGISILPSMFMTTLPGKLNTASKQWKHFEIPEDTYPMRTSWHGLTFDSFVLCEWNPPVTRGYTSQNMKNAELSYLLWA